MCAEAFTIPVQCLIESQWDTLATVTHLMGFFGFRVL